MMREKTLHARRWLELPERGTPGMLRVIYWIAMHLGRWAARLLLYPIALYFLLSAHAARQASHDYLRRVRGGEVRWWHVFRHIHCFAATILDRVYQLAGDFARFDVRVHQKEIFHRQVGSGQGAILLGSHLGSFEMLRTLGVSQQRIPLKVLMDTEHNSSITRFLHALNPEIAATAIGAYRPDTLLKVKESVDQGYMIGALGDRPTGAGKTLRCRFLGTPATFPIGAIQLAAIMQCPVILFFGLYRGGNRYDVHFELLTERVAPDRATRARDIQRWTERYVQRLEHYTRSAPYNWFNFYPFWDD
ncbi:MAG: lipid A biosynthesis acyltransferase [Gammaproteobacteria bacterium]